MCLKSLIQVILIKNTDSHLLAPTQCQRLSDSSPSLSQTLAARLQRGLCHTGLHVRKLGLKDMRGRYIQCNRTGEWLGQDSSVCGFKAHVLSHLSLVAGTLAGGGGMVPVNPLKFNLVLIAS